MNQIFPSKDPRRKWGGYRCCFYAHEYEPIGTKSRELLHIHFISQEGEIKVYLLSSKYLEIDRKWGRFFGHEQEKIKEFVHENYQDIMTKIKEIISQVFSDWSL